MSNSNPTVPEIMADNLEPILAFDEVIDQLAKHALKRFPHSMEYINGMPRLFHVTEALDEVANELTHHVLKLTKEAHTEAFSNGLIVTGKTPTFVTFTGVSGEVIEHLVASIQCMTDGKNTVCIPKNQLDRIPEYIVGSEFNLKELGVQGMDLVKA